MKEAGGTKRDCSTFSYHNIIFRSNRIIQRDNAKPRPILAAHMTHSSICTVFSRTLLLRPISRCLFLLFLYILPFSILIRRTWLHTVFALTMEWTGCCRNNKNRKAENRFTNRIFIATEYNRRLPAKQHLFVDFSFVIVSSKKINTSSITA